MFRVGSLNFDLNHLESTTVTTSWPLGSTTAVRTFNATKTTAHSPNAAYPKIALPRVTRLLKPRFFKLPTAVSSFWKTSTPGVVPRSNAPVVGHTLLVGKGISSHDVESRLEIMLVLKMWTSAFDRGLDALYQTDRVQPGRKGRAARPCACRRRGCVGAVRTWRKATTTPHDTTPSRDVFSQGAGSDRTMGGYAPHDVRIDAPRGA